MNNGNSIHVASQLMNDINKQQPYLHINIMVQGHMTVRLLLWAYNII